MKLVEILSPDMLLPELAATDKDAAIREICAFIAKQRNLRAEDIVKTLLEREKLGSTGIGEGVAIPHGKLAGLDRLQACFARSGRGIDFSAILRELESQQFAHWIVIEQSRSDVSPLRSAQVNADYLHSIGYQI